MPVDPQYLQQLLAGNAGPTGAMPPGMTAGFDVQPPPASQVAPQAAMAPDAIMAGSSGMANVQGPQQPPASPTPPPVTSASERAHGIKGLLASFFQGGADALRRQQGLPTSDELNQQHILNFMGMYKLHQEDQKIKATEDSTNASEALRAQIANATEQHQRNLETQAASNAADTNKRFAADQTERVQTHDENLQFRKDNAQQQRDFMRELKKMGMNNKTSPTVVIQTTDAQGNPVSKIVPKVAGAEYATQATAPTRSMRETAPKVIDLTNKIDAEIDAVSGQLGPGSGRWSEFWAGKVGTDNPKFVTLKTDDKLLSSLLVKMHIGARGAQQIVQQFRDMVNEGKQSPANLHAAVAAVRDYATSVQHPTGAEGGPTTAPPKNADEFLKKFGGVD